MRRMSGFTLLELVIAIGLMVVLAAVAYGSLNGMIRQYEQAARHADEAGALLRTMTMLSNDLIQIQPRSAREPFHGDREPALSAMPGRYGLVEWTRGGWANPAGHRRSTLQRVAWRVEGGTLERLHWWMVDRAPGAEPVVTPLLDDVESVQWRFLDDTGDWHESWPPLNEAIPAPDRLPHGFEVTIRMQDGTVFRRVFAHDGG